MPSYLPILIFAAIAAAILVMNHQRRKKIRENGVEAKATVSRVELSETMDADGDVTASEIYYVTYRNAQGQMVEARLGDPPAGTAAGTELLIKYLPEKPKFVVTAR